MLHGAVAVYSTYSHQLSRKVCIKSAFPLLANLTLLTLLISRTDPTQAFRCKRLSGTKRLTRS